MLTAKHLTTLKSRIGVVSEVLDEQYLPMFRNRQINYQEAWDFSVELSRKKQDRGHYLAKLWGARSLSKTLDWLSKLMNAAKSKVMESIREAKANLSAKKERVIASEPMNREMRRKYERLKKSYFNSLS